jgi:hypothetical protein
VKRGDAQQRYVPSLDPIRVPGKFLEIKPPEKKAD